MWYFSTDADFPGQKGREWILHAGTAHMLLGVQLHSVLHPPLSQSMAGVRPVFHSYIFQISSENSQA